MPWAMWFRSAPWALKSSTMPAWCPPDRQGPPAARARPPSSSFRHMRAAASTSQEQQELLNATHRSDQARSGSVPEHAQGADQTPTSSYQDAEAQEDAAAVLPTRGCPGAAPPAGSRSPGGRGPAFSGPSSTGGGPCRPGCSATSRPSLTRRARLMHQPVNTPPGRRSPAPAPRSGAGRRATAPPPLPPPGTPPGPQPPSAGRRGSWSPSRGGRRPRRSGARRRTAGKCNTPPPAAPPRPGWRRSSTEGVGDVRQPVGQLILVLEGECVVQHQLRGVGVLHRLERHFSIGTLCLLRLPITPVIGDGKTPEAVVGGVAGVPELCAGPVPDRRVGDVPVGAEGLRLLQPVSPLPVGTTQDMRL